jgi:hypothetical protein
VSRVAIVTGGVSGIGLATVRRLELVDVPFSSFDLQRMEGHARDNVGPSRRDNVWQKRCNGAVEFLAIVSGLP